MADEPKIEDVYALVKNVVIPAVEAIDTKVELIDAQIQGSSTFDYDQYMWVRRFNSQLFGKTHDLLPTFTSNALQFEATTTNVNRSNVVGFIQPTLTLPTGLAPVNERYTLINRGRKIILLPKLKAFKIRFTFNFPIGNCRLQIWEGQSK